MNYFLTRKIRMIKNRTSRYLRQILNAYGKTFQSEIINLSNLKQFGDTIHSFSILDLLYIRAKKIDIENIKEYLFVVLDIKGSMTPKMDKYINSKEGSSKFYNFLKYVRTNTHYVDDYWFGLNLHCVVLKVPKDYTEAYRKFITCEYSKMYTEEQLKQIGYKPYYVEKGKQVDNYTYLVLTKDRKANKVLKKVILETYGVTEPPENPREFDVPWDEHEEVRNWQYANEEEQEKIKLIKYK